MMAPILPYLLESNADPENVYEQDRAETLHNFVCKHSRHSTNTLLKQLFFFAQPVLLCGEELLYLNKQQCVKGNISF